MDSDLRRILVECTRPSWRPSLATSKLTLRKIFLQSAKGIMLGNFAIREMLTEMQQYLLLVKWVTAATA